MRRVLHVVPNGLGRGAQVFARALVDELGGPAEGHRLVTLFGDDDDIEVDGTLGLSGGTHGSSGLRVGALAELVRGLGRIDHDLAVAHGGDAFKYLALSSRRPIVYCVIGTWPSRVRRPGTKLAWTALVRRARTAVAVSDDVADDVADVLSLGRARITVIPNGRDDHRFVPVPRSADGPITLLFVGHLNDGKRPHLFVELVERLRAQGSPVTGRMVGDGPLRAELEPRAAAAGIEMIGWTSDVVTHMQRSDALVFPSAPDGEGMPGVLIEAGLCGLPVVATRVPGASTVIEDGRTGLLVGVDDLGALVGAVGRLVDDPPRRRAMGDAARVRCAQSFSLRTVAGRWDELLQSVPTR
jgi:glycosyltransferase involved in cell wall biosynthesis